MSFLITNPTRGILRPRATCHFHPRACTQIAVVREGVLRLPGQLSREQALAREGDVFL